MVSNVTRGGLNPAQIINLSTNKAVNFMFNPFEFTISKSVNWGDAEGTGMGENAPMSKFVMGNARSVSLTIHFDTQDSGGDVTYYSSQLWEMSMIDSKTEDKKTGKGTPPTVAFKWGKLYFKAIITQIDEKFTLFSEKGVPLRSEVTLSLREYVDAKTKLKASISSGSTTKPPTVTQQTGLDRLDNIAAIAGLLASQWRDVASANNIDNPLKVPTGTNILLP
jgi:hypothetical protein